MEPIDYDEFIQANRVEIDKDPLKYLLTFPIDDIERCEIVKKISTVEMAKPSELETEMDIHVNECLRSYNSNYNCMRKNYEQFNSYNMTQTRKQSEYFSKLAKQSKQHDYEADLQQTDLENLFNNKAKGPLSKRSSFLLNDLEKLEPDPIMTNLFERIPIETIDKENDQLRSKDRLDSIFKYYPPPNNDDMIEYRLFPEPLSEHQSDRILVKCTQLKFDLDIEPFWACMALYDLKEKKKISENFAFDLNNDKHKMLHQHQTHHDLSTKAKSCIFNVTYPSNDIFLVIRIEKVLQQGDISECAEPYVKAQQQSQSAVDKLQSQANQFCERLGKYRMPFVWTAINVMSIISNNSNGSQSNDSSIYSTKSSLDRSSSTKTVKKPPVMENNAPQNNNKEKNLSSFKPIAISINTFFKQESDKLSDEDLFRCLNDLKKSTNLIKKLKCLPGSLKMEFSPFNFDLTTICQQKHISYLNNSLNNHFILSPELQFLKFLNSNKLIANHQSIISNNNPYVLNNNLNNNLLPIKEILEFPQHPIYEPNYSYRNLLYIYPLSINLCGVGSNANQSGQTASLNSNLNSSARNIAIKINLMKGEEGEHCALPVIFAKSSSTLEYCKEVYVNVVYHNKTPQYHDEIKIKLPATSSRNSNKYHLLFTFYHITCQSSKDTNQLENVIGYSWLPLRQQFQFETTIHFANNSNENDVFKATKGSDLDANFSSNNNNESTNQQSSNEISANVSTTTLVNKCEMIKSGIYSLPIYFEKLPPGYSNLNSSIYDTNNPINNSNNQSMTDPVIQSASNLFNLDTNSEHNSNSENKIISVNTIISNITTTSSSNASQMSTQSQVNSNVNSSVSNSLKSYFDVRLNLVSTIHTQDVYLERFISISNNLLYSNHHQHLNKNSNSFIETINYNETALLKQAILDLLFASFESLIKFLYIVFDKLLSLMFNYNNKCLSQCCLDVLVRLVEKITDQLSSQNDIHKRNKLLIQYVKYSCNLPTLSFHDDLLNEILNVLSDRKKTSNASSNLILREILLRNLWFFNELIINSLLLRTSQNTSKQGANNVKYFQQNVNKYIKYLTNEISLASNYSKNLNSTLSFFILDLTPILNRSDLFKLIDYYMKCEKINSSLQLDFLRIISSHEHFLTLNLPFMPDLDHLMQSLKNCKQPMIQNLVIESPQDYFKQHYLIGLILKQLFRSLHSQSILLQTKSIKLLRNLFESHDLDQRLYNSNGVVKSKIAYMYFPFVSLCIHFLPFIMVEQKLKSSEHAQSQNKEETDLIDETSNEQSQNGNNLSDHNHHHLDDLKHLYDDFYMECEEIKYFTNGLDIEKYIWTAGNQEEISDTTYDVENLNLEEKGGLQQQQKPFFSKSSNKRNSSNSFNSKTNKQTNNNNIQASQPNMEIPNKDKVENCSNNHVKECSCINYMRKMKYNKEEAYVGFKFAIANFSRETIQDLLACFLWLMKNCDKKFVFYMFSKWPLIKLNKILILLDLCIQAFEYKKTSWSAQKIANKKHDNNNASLAQKITNANASQTKSSSSSKFKTKIEDLKFDLMKKAKNSNTTQSQNNTNELLNTVVNAFISSNSNKTNESSNSILDELDEATKSTLESNLTTECLLICLDIIDLITKLIQQNSSANSNSNLHHHNQYNSSSISGINGLISISNTNCSNMIDQQTSNNLMLPSLTLLTNNIMKLILNSLNLEQSTQSLTNLFSFERSLVHKFPELLFEDDSDNCSEMCMLLLKYCTSQLQFVRIQSSASLYFMMRQNFDIGNNFSRVKMQITISLSNLVAGQFQSQIMNYLKKSLKTILFYSENDAELKESSFPGQCKDLIINLSTILSDTCKMREYGDDDPEMIIDLMHRIANCYQNSPDMRLIWLQNMARKHLQNQNLVEAGHCLIHAAALVAEYLSMIENRAYLPVGCASFKLVSVNVLEESAISDDVLSAADDDAVCSGKYFTESGLIGLIEQAAVFLVHSQNYEAANELYKILIPIFEANKDIKKLCQVYSKLHDCFNKILMNNNRRLFGTYFRVGFYGEKFEDLNGEEFIYKEPGITKLAEIAHRLENFYTQKFGQNCVEIMKDSNNVDKSNLDLLNKAYIQITYVEPYFDRWELQQKSDSLFDKNYSLKRFIYATPFTLDGKAHGPLNQQYKRKTILTTDRAFPYVKTRIKVIDKQQIILGPVEVAIEDLQKKIDELKNATQQEPADPKILQMVLQGCVGTTVNQGPLEMALTFLQPVSFDMITEHHNKLRLCFKEFSRRCAEALKKNKYLIGPDQFEYQKEMEKNYNDLKTRINPLIENKLFKNNLMITNSKGEH